MEKTKQTPAKTTGEKARRLVIIKVSTIEIEGEQAVVRCKNYSCSLVTHRLCAEPLPSA